MKFVDIQRAEFKRLGVLGDWDRPYLTLDRDLRGRDRARARHVRARRLPVSRQEAGARGARATRPRSPRRRSSTRTRRRRRSTCGCRSSIAGSSIRRLEGAAARVRDLDDDAVDAAGEPRDRRAPRDRPTSRSRTRSDPGEYLIVARELAETFAKAIGGGDLAAAIEITPAQMATLEGARYQHPFITERPRRDADVPAVVRRLRDRRRRHRPRAHRARPRRRRLQDRHGARPARVRAARRRRALHRRASRSRAAPRRSTSPASRPTRRTRSSSQHLAATGLPAQPDDRQDPPQLPALLALQGADRVPRDAAVVHRDGPRRAAARRRSPRSTRTDVGPAVGPRSHLRDDREPAGLGAVAPAAVGHADPGVLLHRRAAPRTRAPTRWSTSPAIFEQEGADAWWTRVGRRARAAGHDVRDVRRRARQARAREGHRRRVVRVRRVVARDGAPRRRRGRGPRATSTSTSRAAISTAAGSTARCSPAIGVQGQGAVPAGHHARLRARRRTACRTRRARSRRRRPRARRSSYVEPDDGHQEERRRDVPAVGRVDRVPQRHPVLADDPRRARRVVPQAAQHGAVPARQPQGLRSERARPRAGRRSGSASIATCSRGSTRSSRARARRTRRTSSTSCTACSSSFVTVDLSALYGDVTKDRLYSDAIDSRDAARGAGRAVRGAARDRDAGRADPLLHRRGHLAATCRSARAIRTASTCARSPRSATTPRRGEVDRGLRGAARLARARDQGARAVPRAEEQVGRRRASSLHPPAAERADARALRSASSPICSSCRRSRSAPTATARSRSPSTRARAASAAGSTSTGSPRSPTMSASVAPRHSPG